LDTVKKELMEHQAALSQRLQEMTKLKGTLEEHQRSLETLENDLMIRNSIIEELKKQLSDKQTVFIEKSTKVDLLQHELVLEQEKLQTTLKNLDHSTQEIVRLEQMVQTLQHDQKAQSNLITNKDEQITHLESEITQRKIETERLTEELQKQKKQLEVTMSEVALLQQERNRLQMILDQMQNAIPSSILMINNENRIMSLNAKAVALFEKQTEHILGEEISHIDLLEKERIREGFDHCKTKKEPITVHAVSLQTKEDMRILMDVSQIPLLDATGELQGVMMVLDDVTQLVGLQSELEERRHEIQDLERRYQETFTHLKLMTLEKDAQKEGLGTPTRSETVSQTPVVHAAPEVRVSEEFVPKEGDHHPVAGDIDLLLKKRDDETHQPPSVKHDDEISLKEKLRICDEIEKCLEGKEDKIKTKKLKDEDETP